MKGKFLSESETLEKMGNLDALVLGQVGSAVGN